MVSVGTRCGAPAHMFVLTLWGHRDAMLERKRSGESVCSPQGRAAEVFPSLQQGLWAVCWGTSRGQGSLPIWGVFHAAPRCAQSRRTGGRNGSVVRGSLLLLVAVSKIDVIATYVPQWSPASSRLSGITKAVLLSRDRARLGTPALGMGPARSCQSRHVRSPHCLSVEGAGKGGEDMEGGRREGVPQRFAPWKSGEL